MGEVLCNFETIRGSQGDYHMVQNRGVPYLFFRVVALGPIKEAEYLQVITRG